jgi:hypothetical protein
MDTPKNDFEFFRIFLEFSVFGITRIDSPLLLTTGSQKLSKFEKRQVPSNGLVEIPFVKKSEANISLDCPLEWR